MNWKELILTELVGEVNLVAELGLMTPSAAPPLSAPRVTYGPRSSYQNCHVTEEVRFFSHAG
jgi:hypothetical protein